MEIIIALLTGIIGVVFIDISLVGYIRKPVPLPLRGLLLIGGVLLVVPSYLWSAIMQLITPTRNQRALARPLAMNTATQTGGVMADRQA